MVEINHLPYTVSYHVLEQNTEYFFRKEEKKFCFGLFAFQNRMKTSEVRTT